VVELGPAARAAATLAAVPTTLPDVTVRVGFLGGGFIARYHAMQLRLAAAPNELVAVHDPDPGRAAAFCAAEDGEPVDDVAAVIERVDAAYRSAAAAGMPTPVTPAGSAI